MHGPVQQPPCPLDDAHVIAVGDIDVEVNGKGDRDNDRGLLNLRHRSLVGIAAGYLRLQPYIIDDEESQEEGNVYRCPGARPQDHCPHNSALEQIPQAAERPHETERHGGDDSNGE